MFFKNEKKNKFFFIDLTSYNSFIFNIFKKLLKSNGCIKINLTTSIVTDFHLLNRKEKFLIYLKNFEILKYFYHQEYRRFFNNLFYAKPDYTFISGKKELKRYKADSSIILSSSLDYNKFLISKRFNNLSKIDRLVYIVKIFIS